MPPYTRRLQKHSHNIQEISLVFAFNVKMERKTGLEPAAACLEGRYSTIELLPVVISTSRALALAALSYFRKKLFSFQSLPSYRQVIISTSRALALAALSYFRKKLFSFQSLPSNRQVVISTSRALALAALSYKNTMYFSGRDDTI